LTLLDFVNASRDIASNLNTSTAVPVTVHLLPISLLRTGAGQMIHLIDANVMQQVNSESVRTVDTHMHLQLQQRITDLQALSDRAQKLKTNSTAYSSMYSLAVKVDEFE
jgi:tyrosine-protein phosphatase YwqE